MSETRELRHLTVLVDQDVYAALEAIAAKWTADGHANTPESVAFVALGPAVLALAEQHHVRGGAPCEPLREGSQERGER